MFIYYYINIFVNGNKLRFLGKYKVKIILNAAELLYASRQYHRHLKPKFWLLNIP